MHASVDVLWGWKSLPWRGIAYRRDWLSPVPRPRAGSAGAAWRQCEGLGGGNGRLGWWGHTHHPPTKLPEEIPPEERIQTLCYLSILLGLWAGSSYPLFQPTVLWVDYDFSATVDTIISRLKRDWIEGIPAQNCNPKPSVCLCLNVKAPTFHEDNCRLKKGEPTADPLQVNSLASALEQFQEKKATGTSF